MYNLAKQDIMTERSRVRELEVKMTEQQKMVAKEQTNFERARE